MRSRPARRLCRAASLRELKKKREKSFLPDPEEAGRLGNLDHWKMGSKHLNNPEYMDDADSAEVKKVKLEKSKEELELFESLKHKSMLIEEDNHKVVIFVEAPYRASIKPFMRYSMPCNVDGQGAWDVELDMVDSSNYMSEEMLENLGFARIDFSDYGRRMVRDAQVEMHGFTFLIDFYVIEYANEGDPSILFRRNFLVTTKSKVDFGIGEIRVDLTKIKEEENMGIFLNELDDIMEEVGSTSGEMVKMVKANQNKNYSFNKLTPPSLKIKEIPPSSLVAPSPIYRPLTQKQKEKIKEVLDQKYKELEVPKPILEVLENYVVYKKKLDEVLMGRERLSNKDFSEKVKVEIIEHGLPKKMSDPGNYVLPVKVNGVVEMVALANTGASVSVLPYSLYQNLGLGNPMPYHSNLTMADNTQAKAMVLDIPVDNELPLLLGRPFLRTCGAVIDLGRGIMSIDDGVIRHTYLPKPRVKTILDNLEKEEHEYWLGCFEVRRDEDGYPKYGPVVPSFLDIEDVMERALAMEAYFNPFKNIIVFKKLIDLLGSLPVQLKNTDWGNDRHRLYKKIEGEGAWHAKFEIITPSGCMFTRDFKTKETKRKLSATKNTPPKPLIAKYEKKNRVRMVEYALRPVTNANLKWKDLPLVERHAYYEKFFDETLKEMMKKEYIHEDGDVFVEYSWERALSIERDVYPEWCLEFFSTLYFVKDMDKNYLMNEKRFMDDACIGHYVTQISQSLGYLMDSEIEKYSEPIECKKWTNMMLAGELDVDENKLLGSTELPMPEVRGQEQETSILNSKHSMPILHHLANQNQFPYLTYDPLNVPPYPYPYIPYPHPYMHYPNIGNQSYAGRDFGTSSVPSSGYDVGGSSRGHDDDDDDAMKD
ncbi:putative ribonuclease H-like domain-containing protein [Tanacetum coccineum]